MKTKILFTICTLLLIIVILFLIFSTKKEEKVNTLKFQNMEEFQYLLNNKDNIEFVTAIRLTEGGRDSYSVDANDVVNMISNITIKGKSNISITDDYLTYEFRFKDNTEVSFSFEGPYFHYNNQNYIIEGYKRIELKEENKIEQ